MRVNKYNIIISLRFVPLLVRVLKRLLYIKAFSGCSGLINFLIPDGVIAIGRSAFEDCSGLTSLTLTAGIKKIGDRSFDDCENLTNVSVPAKKTDYYKKRLPEHHHQYIVEREPKKKAKKLCRPEKTL